MFNAAKDAMASKAALHYFNKEMAPYGKLLELNIDSKNKTVDVSCLLNGEPDAIDIHVDNYRIEPAAGKNYVQASGFSCTRPWLERLLQDFAQDRRIELPGWASNFL